MSPSPLPRRTVQIRGKTLQKDPIFGARFISSLLLFAGLIFCSVVSGQTHSQTASQTPPRTLANGTRTAANNISNIAELGCQDSGIGTMVSARSIRCPVK